MATTGHILLLRVAAFPIGLMEKKVTGALVGPLFFSIMKDQFKRLRDGDRFFYRNLDFPCALKAKYKRLYRILDVSGKLIC